MGKGYSRMMSEEKNLTFRGIGVGHGCASGNVHIYQPEARGKRHVYAGVARERERLAEALTQVHERLLALAARTRAELGAGEAEIFEIHDMLLDDEDLAAAMQEKIDSGERAEEAVRLAAEEYADRLRALSDPYLRARAADLGDLSRQLQNALAGEEASLLPDDGRSYLLVARDLAPSETVTLDQSRILGFVTFEGSPNSHTAILARAMGIPALVGVGEIGAVYDGAYALLNAADGTLILSPDRATEEAFEKKKGEVNALAAEHDRYLRSLVNKPAITRSGRKVLIYANVGDGREVASALSHGADGIGLLRSEFLYLSLDRYPTEEELYRNYREIVEAMGGKRIVIRTLDIGADKRIGYFDLPQEENPALGFRGVRICLARRTLFKTQLRAILRASAHGSISVMVPMIVCAREVRECRAILEECCEELSREGRRFDRRIEFGIMIETPSAALMSEELAAEVDFFSVGTNDLLQYTLAADRQNAAVSSLCEENPEPVLRLIEMSAQAIHRHDGWIGICGELAADLHLTQRFADMGIDELSVSVPYLLGVRERVTECK